MISELVHNIDNAVNHLVVSKHVQPVLDNIETVEEDKHCHHKARLQKRKREKLVRKSFREVKGRLYKLREAIMSQNG